METLFFGGRPPRTRVRSYRTYEEWKQFSQSMSVKKLKSSYRTYEEWKRAPCCASMVRQDSSYRTYEEWKQKRYCKRVRCKCVLTVPMRNGNFILSEFLPERMFAFLPYL